MLLDRKKPPFIKPTEEIKFLKAKTEQFDNGVLFHTIFSDKQDVVRIQWVFEAGSAFQQKALIASSTNKLMTDGTASLTSAEIATRIDQQGAFLETNSSADHASISLYSLVSNLEEVLPVVYDILYNANYRHEEVEQYFKLKKQHFLVNNEKVAFIAKNHFSDLIFGAKHAYASKLEIHDFDQIERKDLVDFYHANYLQKKVEIFASGKVTDKVVKLIDRYFGKSKRQTYSASIELATDMPQEKEIFIEKQNALQSAIRIGKQLPLKSHPDFPALFIVNVILGGYFGSRLMTNIREEKGYTYGIGSTIISYKEASYFVISTEVGAAVTEATVKEIELELNRLKDLLVSEKELNLVKNYLKGSIMRGFDGALAAMDRFTMLRNLDLGYDYYDRLIKTIEEMSPNRVREISRKYLEFDQMKKIIVGKEKL